MSELKKYWKGLQESERRALMFAAIVTVLVLFYLLLWKPWHVAIERYHKTVPEKRSDLKWMMAHRDIVANSIGGTPIPTQVSNKGILTVVESMSSKAGLRSTIKQMSPGDNSNEARLWFNEIEFNKWLKLAADLKKKESISVKSANIKSVENGVVDVRATFIR